MCLGVFPLNVKSAEENKKTNYKWWHKNTSSTIVIKDLKINHKLGQILTKFDSSGLLKITKI